MMRWLILDLPCLQIELFPLLVLLGLDFNTLVVQEYSVYITQDIFSFPTPTPEKNIQESRSILTHCILVDPSTVICWTNPFVILGVSCLFCRFYPVIKQILIRCHIMCIRRKILWILFFYRDYVSLWIF